MFNIFSILGKFSAIALMILALIPSAHAEFYDIKIIKIAQKSDTGDVVIRFKPGAKEDGFSGKARAMLESTDININRALAVLLTAVSMGTEVTIQVPNPPTNDDIQVITSTGLVAP